MTVNGFVRWVRHNWKLQYGKHSMILYVNMVFRGSRKLPNLTMPSPSCAVTVVGRCAYGKAGRAGGAVLVSGIVKLSNCILVDNEARLGPAVYNAVTVTLISTDVCDNQLLCDDGSFLDWNYVSYKKSWRTSGGGVMLVRMLMPNGPR